jgi:hypothetical protein
VGTALAIALAAIGVYAMTHHGSATSPRAHYVRRHLREGKPVRAHIRGVGKPSLVFLTLMAAMIIAAMMVRAAL